MDFALKFLWHSTTQGQQNLILDFISFTLFPKLELMIWFFSACSPDHSVYFVPQRLHGPLALGLSAERTPGEAPGGQEELRARAFPSVPPRSPGVPLLSVQGGLLHATPFSGVWGSPPPWPLQAQGGVKYPLLITPGCCPSFFTSRYLVSTAVNSSFIKPFSTAQCELPSASD